jgi:uncharacterized protein (TIGR03663 family)
MTNKAFRGLFLLAVVGALLFRFVRLDIRPMHHDEANQAVKFGDLLERGEYRFDPQEHHGPSLYYLTLPAARLAGADTLARLDETTLRAVPAFFGVALLLLFLLFGGGLSREATLAAAALAAVSPALTYYSRFYIQETLLVFFLAALIGTGWRYARTRSAWWALAAGAAAGLMAATKETSVLLFAGLLAAFGIVAALERVGGRHRRILAEGDAWVWRDFRVKMPKAFHIGLFLFAAAAVGALFYSSFFSHPEGLVDAVRAIGASFAKAAHPGVHAQPWDYYLRLLAWTRTAGGPVWSESFLLFLAAAGGVAAFGREAGHGGNPRFARFILFFTLITTAVYGLVPYKTPWNVLPFYLGLVLLAGNGVAFFLRVGRFRVIKFVVPALLFAGFLNLAFQAYRADFVHHSDVGNPYAYAATSLDLLRLIDAVERVAEAAPEHRDLLVKVVAPADETWPLPWYLRGYGRVGYWTEPGPALAFTGAGEAAVVITSAGFSDEVGAALGEGYDQRFFGLRPEVPLCLFTKRSP